MPIVSKFHDRREYVEVCSDTSFDVYREKRSRIFRDTVVHVRKEHSSRVNAATSASVMRTKMGRLRGMHRI